MCLMNNHSAKFKLTVFGVSVAVPGGHLPTYTVS